MARTEDIRLSVLITVVSGPKALRRCLGALRAQLDTAHDEIIVPYDRWSRDVAALRADFPAVRFHFVDDPGGTASPGVGPHAHGLYERRRAVGLALARGAVVAMTEDHAVPAADWCRQILAAHEQGEAVIGGAIDNAVDVPMNWALYYCDFGRFGRPLQRGPAAYVSDVNVSYKRRALEATRPLWRDAYHETTVHWALQDLGETLVLDPRLVVHQHRPPITLCRAYAERVQWGRVFAETRAAACAGWQRLGYAAGTPLLPLLLAVRIVRHMRRQRRGVGHIARTLPLALVLTTGWSLGELLGSLVAAPASPSPALDAAPASAAERSGRC
jgi:hypothetical protein